MTTLRSVGLLGPGVWDCDPQPLSIDRAYLQRCAHYYRVNKHPIPVHFEHGGARAGRAFDIRIIGDELVGDLFLDDWAARMVRDASSPSVSVATEVAGDQIKLAHVALIPRWRRPAYTAQRPLSEFLSTQEKQMSFSCSKIARFSVPTGGRIQLDERTGEPIVAERQPHNHTATAPCPWQEAADQLAELADDYADRHGCDAREALHHVMADAKNRPIVEAYARRVQTGDKLVETEHPPRRPESAARRNVASIRLHNLAVAYQKAHNVGYRDAVQAVTSDPANRAAADDWVGR